jgi:hypothetical protein
VDGVPVVLGCCEFRVAAIGLERSVRSVILAAGFAVVIGAASGSVPLVERSSYMARIIPACIVFSVVYTVPK